MGSLRSRTAVLTGTVAILASLLAAAPVAASSGEHHHRLVCRDGVIAPGAYDSIVVTGDCGIAGGDVTVTHDIVVRPHASLWKDWDDARLRVGGDVIVLQDGMLSLGCSLPGCLSPRTATGPVTGAARAAADHVHSAEIAGSVRALNVYTILMIGTTVGGNVEIAGGGSPRHCQPGAESRMRSGAPVVSKVDLFLDEIGGSTRITRSRMCSIFVGFDTVGRDVSLVANRATACEPSATGQPCAFGTGIVIQYNTIGRNLACWRNSPPPAGLDRVGSLGGRTFGQCAPKG